MITYREDCNGDLLFKDGVYPKGHPFWDKAYKEALIGNATIVVYLPNNDESLAQSERFWRDSELTQADHCINELLDCGFSSDRVDPYRDYRRDLRDWPAHSKFPDQDYRPVLYTTGDYYGD